jgi:four helix bundle protein
MFEAREVGMQIAKEVKLPMETIRTKRAEMGDQIERAIASMVLNIGEASRRAGRDRTNRYRYAAGSLAEARDAIELSVAWGFVGEDAVKSVLALMDRELAMLWRLEHPRKR